MPAPNDQRVYPISSRPGVKRDGTPLDGDFYTDAVWCRFRNGRPKKIGGYREIINLSSTTVPSGAPDSPIRELIDYSDDPQNIIYAFHGNGITGAYVDANGVGGSAFDRTPAGFSAGDIYTWQADFIYDSSGTPASKIIAHGAPALNNINSTSDAPVYIGDASDSAALVSIGESVSGGIVVLQPVLVIYGNDGLLKNSDANDPTSFVGGVANEANVSASKIVKGMPLRGGSSSPAGLFWSLDSLIRMSYTGTEWKYDTVTSSISILGQGCVVEYDGVYYWPSLDRFLVYNGVVKEVPNQMNQDFFFDNINIPYRQKAFGTKLPRWGEIWWFFPKYPATECNWAVVYNVRENLWFDTPIYRSAGHPPHNLTFPFWADSEPNDYTGATGYRIYRHEIGSDAVFGETQQAISSHFETGQLGFATGGPDGSDGEAMNVQTRITRIEQDFVQSGDMTVEVTGESYAQDEEVMTSAPQTFPEASPAGSPAVVDVSEQRRLLRLKFKSNVSGGNYHMGKVLCHLEPGDGRG